MAKTGVSVFYYFSIFLPSVVRIIGVKVCSKIPYSARRMLTSKIAYFAERSAGRIYPSLRMGLVRTFLLNILTTCSVLVVKRTKLDRH